MNGISNTLRNGLSCFDNYLHGVSQCTTIDASGVSDVNQTLDVRELTMDDKQLQVFLEYTSRFEAMSAELPMFIRLNNSEGINHNSDPDFLESFMLRYLNTCSEEWFLHEQKLITEEVWKMWKHYIEETLSGSKPFGEFWWNKCRKNFLNPDGPATPFVTFSDTTVLPQEQIPKSTMATNHTVRATINK